MAKKTDLSGIKQIIQPLEESGTLIRRTDEEVWHPAVSYVLYESYYFSISC